MRFELGKVLEHESGTPWTRRVSKSTPANVLLGQRDEMSLGRELQPLLLLANAAGQTFPKLGQVTNHNLFDFILVVGEFRPLVSDYVILEILHVGGRVPAGAEDALAAQEHEAVASGPEQLLKQCYRHSRTRQQSTHKRQRHLHDIRSLSQSRHSVNLDGERCAA